MKRKALFSSYGWRDARLDLLQLSGRLSVQTMRAGIASGARFTAGPSNPEYADGSNELPVQRAFADLLQPDMVCFDVGSNVGFFSILAARLVGPAGRVFAFEPVPGNAAFVRLNSRLNALGNISVVEKAVGSSAGVSNFFIAHYSGGGALEAAGRPPDHACTTLVDVISLDDWVASGALPVPHLVKIDVEGAELQVLEGMQGTLRKHHPAIIFEIDGAEPDAVRSRYEACCANLRDHGYSIRELENSYPEIKWTVFHGVATRGARA